MEPVIWVWLGVLVIFVICELITPSLTTIWFAGGAFAAFITALFKLPLWSQIVVFFVVSLVLLFFTRPVFTKIFKIGSAKTNVEGLIGKKAKVVEEINNNGPTGCAVVGGQEWTARAEDDAEIIPPNSLVEIVRISGVKLIVRQLGDGE
ncbi:MAG: NfeD family protein [Butyrivibrio sp.]|nr:NfeD family protein [Butyrivibrio sp.]